MSDIIHWMIDAILEHQGRLIQLPTLAQCGEVGRGFELLAKSPAFSTCVGAIDGCHVRIKAPSTPDAQDYFNRKLCYSLYQRLIHELWRIWDPSSVWVGVPESGLETQRKDQGYTRVTVDLILNTLHFLKCVFNFFITYHFFFIVWQCLYVKHFESKLCMKSAL